MTKTVKLPLKVIHDVEIFAGAFKPLGVEIKEEKLLLNTSIEAENWAEAFLRERGIKSGEIIIGLNPGAFR